MVSVLASGEPSKLMVAPRLDRKSLRPEMDVLHLQVKALGLSTLRSNFGWLSSTELFAVPLSRWLPPRLSIAPRTPPPRPFHLRPTQPHHNLCDPIQPDHPLPSDSGPPTRRVGVDISQFLSQCQELAIWTFRDSTPTLRTPQSTPQASSSAAACSAPGSRLRYEQGGTQMTRDPPDYPSYACFCTLLESVLLTRPFAKSDLRGRIRSKWSRIGCPGGVCAAADRLFSATKFSALVLVALRTLFLL